MQFFNFAIRFQFRELLAVHNHVVILLINSLLIFMSFSFLHLIFLMFFTFVIWFSSKYFNSHPNAAVLDEETEHEITPQYFLYCFAEGKCKPNVEI